MLETSFCCQLGAILQKDFSKMTTAPPMTERLRVQLTPPCFSKNNHYISQANREYVMLLIL
jgi:hypothetical protein